MAGQAKALQNLVRSRRESQFWPWSNWKIYWGQCGIFSLCHI